MVLCRTINWLIGKSNLAHCWIDWLLEMHGLQQVCSCWTTYLEVYKLWKGHYASKAWVHSTSGPRPMLVRPSDRKKDQTYFLSSISESALNRALFPLANLTKPEVRALAKANGLATAERPDSVGICFVGQKARFHQFLGLYLS